MLNKILKSAIIGVAAMSVLSCSGSKAEKPFFQLRGIIVAWDDIKDPDNLDWIELMKKNSLNTISVFGHDYDSPEYYAFKQKCIDAGLDFEYEEHAMTWLLPRELFATHPEYFRMDENGVRRPDGNGCPSSQEALEVMMSNVPAFAKIHTPTNHKYYTWLFDGGDVCHCEKCRGLNVADQGLIFENHIIKALKKIDPEAKLAHLAYHNSTPAPSKIKPEKDIFLEWAPFLRRWDKPLSDKEARREDQVWTHGDYIRMLEDNLKVFPAETAQVLEYWMDDSLYSGWKKPQVQVPWHKDVFLQDIALYASYGIRNITAYAAYVDSWYLKTYKDISFVDDYGQGLLNYRPKK